MNLPVHVREDEMKKYPELSNLLESLMKHLNEDGHSRTVEKDLIQAENNVEREKLSFLQQHILNLEIHEMLTEHETEDKKEEKSELIDALRECMSTAEACSYLHPRLTGSGEDTVPLLGLTKEHLIQSNPHMKKLPTLQQHFIPELERRLMKKCEEVANGHISSTQGDSDQLAFAKSTRLPDVLRMETTKLNEETKMLKNDQLIRRQQYWKYYQALNETLTLLEELITRHRLEVQSEKDSVVTDWLSARCHAMHLKIRVFRTKLLCEMYSPEAVAALKQIQQHLKLNIHEKETKLSQYEQTLQAYKAIGGGFEALVLEYEQLQKAVANKKWALKELKQSMNEEETLDWKL